MIVQQPVVILVLSQEGVRALPSTPPSWLILCLPIFNDVDIHIKKDAFLFWWPLATLEPLGNVLVLFYTFSAFPLPQFLTSFSQTIV